jgi:hypothetical protein
LRVAGIVLTLKAACTTFGMLNGVKGAFKLRYASIRNEIPVISSRSTNGGDLRVAGHVSTLKAASTTFGVLNGVKRAENFGMPQSGTKYQSFRQNRRMAALCELQGLF